MSIVTLPYIFQPGTTIASAQVNADFAALTNAINGNLDGTNLSTVFSSLNLAVKGHGTFPGGLIIQWGAPGSVAFDNSGAQAVTFDIPFPTAVLGIVTGVSENTLTKAALVSAFTNVVGVANPLAGFNLTAMGGAAGATGTIFWFAWGY